VKILNAQNYKEGGRGVFQIPRSEIPRCPFPQNLGSQTSSGGPPAPNGSIPFTAVSSVGFMGVEVPIGMRSPNGITWMCSVLRGMARLGMV
jgi:hypothetical protein